MDLIILILMVIGTIIAAIAAYYTIKSYRKSSPNPPNRDSESKVSKKYLVEEPYETLAFLLILDQFKNGIWGASLESTSDLWGHPRDPGSITVSTNSCLALTYLSGSRSLKPIQKYREYLFSRQSERGAFGMLRDDGTKNYPNPKILEHTRHTASGLEFFLNYDGINHLCVINALRFLMNTDNRTQNGVWVDYGELVDKNADPITASFVVGILDEILSSKNFQASNREEYVSSKEEIDDTIKTGLRYIFSTKYRTKEGFWHYRYSTPDGKKRVLENLFQYSADVLGNIKKACVRDKEFREEAYNIIKELLKITNSYKGGLPKSPYHNLPDLDATSSLLNCLDVFGPNEKELESILGRLIKMIKKERIIESANASGWSSFLLLSKHDFGSNIRISKKRLNYLWQEAELIKSNDYDLKSLPKLKGVSSDYFHSILSRLKGKLPT